MINQIDSLSFTVKCDECGEDLVDVFLGTFYELVEAIKREGWLIWKDNDTGEWEHYCTECRKNGGMDKCSIR